MATTTFLSKAVNDAATSILSHSSYPPQQPPPISQTKPTDSTNNAGSEDGASTPLPSTPQLQQPPYTFSFTPFLRTQGLASLISTTPICPAYLAGHCPLGRRCPDRHPTPSSTTTSSHRSYHTGTESYVCKHWLKALCKKGTSCDFLHEYNMRKMSECQFYNTNGFCQNGDECLYLHVKESARIGLCEDYESGFCERGPRCEKRHVRRKVCEGYLAGFCPEGRECRWGVHLKGRVKDIGKDKDGPGLKEGPNRAEEERRRRLDELERREEEERKREKWGDQRGERGDRGGGGGGGGRGRKGRWGGKRNR